MEYHTERPERRDSVKPTTLVALDLDRTLLDSTAFVQKVFETLERENPDQADVIKFVQDQEQARRGQGYDYMDALRLAGIEFSVRNLADTLLWYNSDSKTGHYSDDMFERLVRPGAVELLDEIDYHPELTAMVITAGGNDTQILKLAVFKELVEQRRRSGEALPAIVVPEGGKARRLAELFSDSEGKGLSAEQMIDNWATAVIDVDDGQLGNIQRVIMVDDKPSNIESADARVEGVLVSPFSAQSSQGGQLDLLNLIGDSIH